MKETFVVHICDFKAFDMKAAPCEVQMTLMVINVENSIRPEWLFQVPVVLGGSCPKTSRGTYSVSRHAHKQIVLLSYNMFCNRIDSVTEDRLFFASTFKSIAILMLDKTVVRNLPRDISFRLNQHESFLYLTLANKTRFLFWIARSFFRRVSYILLGALHFMSHVSFY